MVNKAIEKNNLDEIATIIKKAIGGDYSARIKLNGKDNGLDIVAARINMLINHTKMGIEGFTREIDILKKNNERLKREILKLKKTQETLEESEEKFSKVFQASANAIFINNLSRGIIIEANESFTCFTGYNREEVVGHSPYDLNLFVYEEEMQEWMKMMEEQGRVYNHEFHSRMKSGEVRVGLGSTETVTIGGEQCGFVIITDITEKKQIEEALEVERQNFRNSIDNSLLGIMILNADSQVLYGNQALLDIVGYDSTEEFSTIPEEKRFTPESLAKFNERCELRRAGKDLPSSYEVDILRKDGQMRNIVIFNRDIIWNGKQQFQTIWHDVTEQKRAETEREAFLEDLQKLNIKFEESNRELQDFVYVASHDLREPLRKIASFGALLEDSLKDKLDEDQQENFQFMIDGSNRMQTMVDDLLIYSRVTTKARPFEQVDLNCVIEDIKNIELAKLLEETGGTINIPEKLLSVNGDSSQLHQLFQNLIGNGLKFRRSDTIPEVTIRTSNVKRNMIRVEIHDNGIGIDQKYHDQIFTMFKRLHSRTQFEGTGIGLAVCKKIVRRHGGEIGVESTPGKGSTFWFTLPGV